MHYDNFVPILNSLYLSVYEYIYICIHLVFPSLLLTCNQENTLNF